MDGPPATVTRRVDSHLSGGVGSDPADSAFSNSSQCGAGRITGYGYRAPALFPADGADATHVKVTPHAAAGATVRVGKATYTNSVESVAWATVASGAQSAAIALNNADDGDGTGSARDTIIKVEVTHSGGVNTYTVSIQKPVGGL